jgi:large subunit ribosomal protein L23
MKKSEGSAVVLRPIVTEKSHRQMEEAGGRKRSGAPTRRYTFEVHRDANKIDVRRAVEELFGVKVIGVNTQYVRPKRRRVGFHQGYTRGWKKAVVRLAPGQTIELY